MALRRPALEAGRLSIRRVPLPLYKLGSQICSISVSCALSKGNQARQAVVETRVGGGRFAKRKWFAFRSLSVSKGGVAAARREMKDPGAGGSVERVLLQARDGGSMRSSTEQKIKINDIKKLPGQSEKKGGNECADEEKGCG